MEKKSLLKSIGKIKRIRVRRRNKKQVNKKIFNDNKNINQNQTLSIEKKDYDKTSDEILSIDKICFDHIITDIEVRLKYLNLKDKQGKEYGSFIPINPNLIIVKDQDNEEYKALRVGFNQISLDLPYFINKNNITSGKTISIEFNKSDISNQKCIIYIKHINVN